MRIFLICIVLHFVTSPIYSQTDIYELKQLQFQSTDLVFQRLPEILHERLQPQIQLINNPYWPNYIDVYDIESNDLFTAMPSEESGRNNPVNNNGSKIISGVIYGFVIGMGGAIIGARIGEGICEIDCPFYGILIGGLISYHYGVARGVNKIGNINNENGSFAAALKGGIVGHIAGIAALSIFPNTATGVFWFISAPIGATIGYNRSRKFESNDRLGTALINLNGRQIELAAPMIYFHRIQFTNRHVQMIDILHVDL